MPISYEDYIKLSRKEREDLLETATEEEKQVYVDYAIKAGEEAKAKKEEKPHKEYSEAEIKAKNQAKVLNQQYRISKDSIVDMCKKFVNTVGDEEKVQKDVFLEDYKECYKTQFKRFVSAVNQRQDWDRNISSINKMIEDFDEMAILSIKRKTNVEVPKFGGMDKLDFNDFLVEQFSRVKATDDSYFRENFNSKKRGNRKFMKSLKENDIEKIVNELQKNFSDALKVARNIEDHRAKSDTVFASITLGYKTLQAAYDSQSWWYKLWHSKTAKLERDTLNSIKATCEKVILYNGNQMKGDDFFSGIYTSYPNNYVVLGENEKFDELFKDREFTDLKEYVVVDKTKINVDELENLNINQEVEKLNQLDEKKVDNNLDKSL